MVETINSLLVPVEKFFHGDLYSEGPWNSLHHVCCRLCKTKNPEGKNSHWCKGLCRSCYRRLLISHRLYNDQWLEKNSFYCGNEKNKKTYKQLGKEAIVFKDEDIETLLDRYDWKCAYSKVPLQNHDHKQPNAFQIEYVVSGGQIELVPVSRAINCSKKSLMEATALMRWAKRVGVSYPFNYVSVEQFLD